MESKSGFVTKKMGLNEFFDEFLNFSSLKFLNKNKIDEYAYKS